MSSSHISLDLYHVFCAVARCRSVTLAAEELYLSQPAVSRSIRQLEQALDCRLFLRTPKGVALTSEGRRCTSMRPPGLRSSGWGNGSCGSCATSKPGKSGWGPAT